MVDISLDVNKTLAIENIPQDMCSKENIMAFFKEIYPKFKILDVQLAFDVEKLTALCEKLKNVKLCKKYAKSYNKRNEDELKIFPYKGARFCFCFLYPCVERQSCVQYYTQKEEKLKQKIETCREKSLRTKLGKLP